MNELEKTIEGIEIKGDCLILYGDEKIYNKKIYVNQSGSEVSLIVTDYRTSRIIHSATASLKPHQELKVIKIVNDLSLSFTEESVHIHKQDNTIIYFFLFTYFINDGIFCDDKTISLMSQFLQQEYLFVYQSTNKKLLPTKEKALKEAIDALETNTSLLSRISSNKPTVLQTEAPQSRFIYYDDRHNPKIIILQNYQKAFVKYLISRLGDARAKEFINRNKLLLKEYKSIVNLTYFYHRNKPDMQSAQITDSINEIADDMEALLKRLE